MMGITQFKKNPKYLLQNNLNRIVIFFLLNAVLAIYFRPSIKEILFYTMPIVLLSTGGILTTALGLFAGVLVHIFLNGFNLTSILFSVGAIGITFIVTSIYHSAAHESFKPRWLNRVLGEICGLIHTSNLDEWGIIHYFHHLHADDPLLDPHPPTGLTFIEFASTTGQKVAQSLGIHYFKTFDANEYYSRIIKQTSMTIFTRQLMLTVFWYLLLGPEIFLYFFGVNIVFKKTHYAWLNWATHGEKQGKVQVFNRISGIYRIINLISLNLYYHKNHHARPYLYNPKKANLDADDNVENAA